MCKFDSFGYTTNNKGSDAFWTSGGAENDYSIKQSEDFFGQLEGNVRSPLFNCGIRFHVKGDDPIYARRCAEYIEAVTAENLKEQTALYSCLEALVKYAVDMLEERGDELDLGDLIFDENSTVDDLLKLIAPTGLEFERSDYIAEEECPIAFSMKLAFTPVADEYMEIALHGDEPVYAGEYRDVSPWNEKLLKKKYNYLKGTK